MYKSLSNNYFHTGKSDFDHFCPINSIDYQNFVRNVSNNEDIREIALKFGKLYVANTWM